MTTSQVIKEYLEHHISDFDLIGLFDEYECSQLDRDGLEEEIRKATVHILATVDTEEPLFALAQRIAFNDFMVFRGERIQRYWANKEVSEKTTEEVKENMKTMTQLLGSEYRRQYATRSHSSREKATEMDGVKLPGIKDSAGTRVKRAALDIIQTGCPYKDLDEVKKDTVFFGLNSITDLSNNSDEKASQKSKIGDGGWKLLKGLAYANDGQERIPADIKKELKEIEQLALKDVKSAYTTALVKQHKYALTSNDAYFCLYAHFLRLIYFKSKILGSKSKSSVSEADYIVKVWGPLFETIFNDSGLVIKWGETVPKESTIARKENADESGEDIIGDKVDMRVFLKYDGLEYDLMNGEYANASQDGETKFSQDHRKVLRESKVIFDTVARKSLPSKKELMRILVPSFQATGLEGELMVLRIIAPGLYTAQRIGSLPVPHSCSTLRYLRKSIERLLFAKMLCSRSHRLLLDGLTTSTRNKKRKGSQMARTPSPRSTSSSGSQNSNHDESWLRPTWFPPSGKRSRTQAISPPKNLFPA